jgi:hypothetical protein
MTTLIVTVDLPEGSVGVPYTGSFTVDAGPWSVFSVPHLNGKTVNVLADGFVIKGLVVTDDLVTLPFPASYVYIGLPYVSELETLQLEVNAPGLEQSKLKKIAKLWMRVTNTLGPQAGPNAAGLLDLKWRTNEVYGVPTNVFTGDKELSLTPKWNRDGRTFVRQTDPLPVTILALIPEVVPSDL